MRLGKTTELCLDYSRDIYQASRNRIETDVKKFFLREISVFIFEISMMHMMASECFCIPAGYVAAYLRILM